MDQVTIILPGIDSESPPDSTLCHRQSYPVNSLRQSSSYFDAMLGGQWAETRDDGGERNIDDSSYAPVVDLSQSGLDPAACASILQFMMSRYDSANDNNRDGSCGHTTQHSAHDEDAAKTGERTRRKNVSLAEMKVMFWEGFQWDEEYTTVDWGEIMQNDEHESSKKSPPSLTDSDEVTLYQAIDYLHLQPHEEIISKLWAMKLVNCPSFLEEALKKQGFVGSMGESEGSEMCIKTIPGMPFDKDMWRYLVCMFICRMFVYEEDGTVCGEKDDDLSADQIRATNHRKPLETCRALTQLSYLGVGEKPMTLLREMVYFGLLRRELDESAHWQTPLDRQVIKLWEFLDWFSVFGKWEPILFRSSS